MPSLAPGAQAVVTTDNGYKFTYTYTRSEVVSPTNVDAPGGSPHSPGRAWTAPRLAVNAPGPVHAGIDGEAVDLDPPLRFASRPASLRVRISPLHPGASPSARLHLPGHSPG